MIKTVFDPEVWQKVPFHFWSVVFFIFGSIVGSFLNVCIYRMPLGLSVVRPPSHCPNCKYSIPWWLNIPLVTWLVLKGRCKNCGTQISIRYYLVELLTAIAFLYCWLRFGAQNPAVALVYCLLIAGFIAATFIDFQHFIIPDEITLGGIGAGLVCSFLVPSLHAVDSRWVALLRAAIGMAVGAGIIYAILRAGKILFGRQRVQVPADAKIVFTETAVLFADKEVPYEDLFYRASDVITLRARTLELIDRCYKDVLVKLSPARLQIGDEELNPEDVPHMEAVSEEIILPREAMGLGDVKFMAAIGAFLGWKVVIFTLMISSIIGSIVGLGSIAIGKRAWSSRLPYGPYIALAATICIFWGRQILDLWNWWFFRRFGG